MRPIVLDRNSIVLLSMLIVSSGCPNAPDTEPTSGTGKHGAAPNIQFEDVPAPWEGDGPFYENGEQAGILSILESLGGGVGVIDYDLDGCDDFIFPGGGELSPTQIKGLPNRLQRRSGTRYVEVATVSGIATSRHYSHGCAVADYNNDGFDDVLITGYGGCQLYENQGDGTFLDVTISAGIDDDSWSSSAGWGDLNGDGVLDLYLAHYVDWSLENNPPCQGPGGKPDVCPPRQFNGLDDALYLGNSEGTFTNASASAGLVSGGKGLGVILADLDNDSDLDLYVANDTTNNFLYLNDGQGNLTEEGVLAGAAFDDLANANGSMGLAVMDFNNDQHPDIWVTNYEDEVSALYEGSAGANFQHVSSRVGIQMLGKLYVGFGCVAVDFNLDGFEDIAISNGHVVHYPRNAPVRQKPLLFTNLNGEKLERVSPQAGTFLDTPALGRGLVRFDFDDDGRPDLLFANSNQAPVIVRNRSASSGKSLRIQLIGRESNRSAIGATVKLLNSEGKTICTRWNRGGGSYLSSSSSLIHFGVPEDVTIGSIQVNWPGGFVTSFRPSKFHSDFMNGRIQQIVEPVRASFGENSSVPVFYSLPASVQQ